MRSGLLGNLRCKQPPIAAGLPNRVGKVSCSVQGVDVRHSVHHYHHHHDHHHHHHDHHYDPTCGVQGVHVSHTVPVEVVA